MRKQAGFRDAITLGSEDSLHVTAISIRETKEQAEAYNTGGYLDVDAHWNRSYVDLEFEC